MFVDTRVSLNHSIGLVERSPRAKTRLPRSSSLIEHRLVTDRQTDRHGQTDTWP